MRIAHATPHGSLPHVPPLWFVSVAVVIFGAANLAFIVAVVAGRFG